MVKRMMGSLLLVLAFGGVTVEGALRSSVSTAEEGVLDLPDGGDADALNVVCNDGTESPTCEVCRRGCCSHHGGCR